jgi:hypothetical protein
MVEQLLLLLLSMQPIRLARSKSVIKTSTQVKSVQIAPSFVGEHDTCFATQIKRDR